MTQAVVKPDMKSQISDFPASTIDLQAAHRAYGHLRLVRPATRRHLRDYVRVFLGIDVPDVPVCRDHAAPMDYLWHAFNSDFASGVSSGDAVVWANRAGGKTRLAAVATLLDCLFKPGCAVRILGGSAQQSARMYEYLADFVHRGFQRLLDGQFLKERCRFLNGSGVEVMTQSARNVRGRHIHKLRCDEVELFDEGVFDAAKFITHSTDDLTAAMEIASTMHRPYGLMQKVITQARQNRTPVFKWCMFEVIQRCTGRTCSRCALEGYCRGKAKHASGYLKIDDCITQMKRSSGAAFEAEMLCIRPTLDNAVFADFDETLHVAVLDYDASLPLYRAIDFGFVNPFVCLWIQIDGSGVIRVIDEYVRRRATISAHAEAIKSRTPCAEELVCGTFCDPAGAARGHVTGTSPVKELRDCGIAVRYRPSAILEGIELIRRALRRGDGTSTMLISPRCRRLIEAMRCYHYPDSAKSLQTELPEKDGVYDHPIDALRYFFVNYNRPKPTARRY